jgi:hypothetical protein
LSNPGDIYKTLSAEPPPKTGDLVVWWIPQVPGEAFRWRVENLEQARNVLRLLAAYDDFEFAAHVKGDYCNAGGLMVFDDEGDWVDWEDEEGRSIDEVMSEDQR